MTEIVQLVCPRCRAINRAPRERFADRPVCAKCRAPLLASEPVELDANGLERFVASSGLPVVVDFWAPWCGPCRSMAPHFARAAAELAGRAVLAKVDTQAHPDVGAQHGVQAIPTLVAFVGGRERARQSGAMSATDLVRWIESATR